MGLTISTANFMFTAIRGGNGFHLLDLMPSRCRFSTQYFLEHVMAPLVQTLFAERRTWYTPRLTVHLDNSRIHFAKVMEQFFIENQLMHVPHPLYSPDSVPSDFWIFGRIKTGLAGSNFAEPEELLEDIREFMEGISAAELTAVFEGWIDRVRWVIAHNKQYYGRQMLYNQSI
jgi:hypothetical protein